MEQKLVQRCETEVDGDACKASYTVGWFAKTYMKNAKKFKSQKKVDETLFDQKSPVHPIPNTNRGDRQQTDKHCNLYTELA